MSTKSLTTEKRCVVYHAIASQNFCSAVKKKEFIFPYDYLVILRCGGDREQFDRLKILSLISYRSNMIS